MTDIKHNVEFGRVYRDELTGFEGVATGVTYHITRCTQVCLQPRVKEDKSLPEAYWMDESHLVDAETGERVAQFPEETLPEPKPQAKVGGPPVKAARPAR